MQLAKKLIKLVDHRQYSLHQSNYKSRKKNLEQTHDAVLTLDLELWTSPN